jgi:hypothetical protein
MKKNILYISIPVITALLLAGCSLENTVSRLAAPNGEQGAREQYIQNQILEAKQKRIEEKRQQFTQTTQLTNVNESDPYEAFVFSSSSDGIVKIELEAILPNPGRQIYELWLRDPAAKETKNLGALQFNQTDDYSLSYSGELDLESFSNVILTREASPDNQPETIIMTGSLTTSTP